MTEISTGSGFADAIDEWVKQTQARIEAVARTATQKLASAANNGVPVDTGFARASFQAGSEPIKTSKARPVPGVSYNSADVNAAIAEMDIGGTFYLGWSANYIVYLEYGSSSQAPQGFARIAVAQWPRFCREAVAEAKASVGA